MKQLIGFWSNVEQTKFLKLSVAEKVNTISTNENQYLELPKIKNDNIMQWHSFHGWVNKIFQDWLNDVLRKINCGMIKCQCTKHASEQGRINI